MKICLINNLFFPYARGGAEKVVMTIARGLLRAGHEVTIITSRPWFKKRASLNENGPTIYYIRSFYYYLDKIPKFFRLIWHLYDMFDPINFFKVRRILKLEKCQAVITNNLMGISYLVPLAIKNLQLKHIHHVHDIQLIHPSGILNYGEEKKIESYWSRNYAALASQLFFSPAAVIFPTRWLMDRHLDKIFFIKSKRIVLPNPAAFSPTVSQAQSGKFKFLYLGQIEKHKGLILLIQAFKRVNEKFPQTELIIAGEGSELASAKVKARENDNIKFLGWQKEEQVGELLRSSDSLVVPTLCYENCPAVILEAFSAGLPVMAADLGGIGELLSGNAGILFHPANPAELTEKMVWAVENKKNLSEYAKKGREKAVLFRVENYIKELETLIE